MVYRTAFFQLVAFLPSAAGGDFWGVPISFSITASGPDQAPEGQDLLPTIRNVRWQYWDTCMQAALKASSSLGQFQRQHCAVAYLRKRTMLITTAKWMTKLPVKSMTPERRHWPNIFTYFVEVVSNPSVFMWKSKNSLRQGNPSSFAEDERDRSGEEIPWFKRTTASCLLLSYT